MTRTVVLTLVWAIASFLQQPQPRDAARGAEAGTGVVRGRVTDAETGAPLARVALTLALAGSRSTVLETVSDTNGAFEFRGVPAGEYGLSADPTRRATHRPGRYGMVAGRSTGLATIAVRDGEVFEQANIVLARSYVISGRVFDEDGEPVPEVPVDAQPVDPRAGGGGVRPRTTDDRGAFRLWGVAAGTYRVCATPLSAGPDQRSAEGFIRTCYPSTPQAEAQPVVVTAADPPEIEIRLRRSRLFRVSGLVIDAAGEIAPQASLSFLTIDREHGSMTSRNVQNEGGAFSIHGLAPGEYFIRAELASAAPGDDRSRQLGLSKINVQAGDIDHLVVALERPVTIRGRIVLEGTAAPASPLRVRADPAADSVEMYAGSRLPPVRVKPDLSFEVRGLFGAHTIDVEGAPGWVVKSMRYRGEERAHLPTEFQSTPDAALEIVLTNRTARLTGRVVDDAGRALQEGMVILFSTDPRQWDGGKVPAYVRVEAGAFEAKNLRAGEYFVVALRNAAGRARFNRSALEEIARTAGRVVLQENDVRTLNLSVRE